MINYRYLGNSGLKITELTYGNWLTHGSQVENDAASRVRQGRARRRHLVLRHGRRLREHRGRDRPGRHPQGRAPRKPRDLHQGLLAHGPGGANDSGLSRKHIMESINGSLRRLQTDYVDLYQAHRYDTETPLEETMQAFADVVRQGKAHYIGVSEWTADQIRAGAALAKDLGIPADLLPASVLDAVARDRGRGGSRVQGVGPQPDRVVARRAGRPHRQVQARPGSPGRLARDGRQGRQATCIGRFLENQDCPGSACQKLQPIADELDLTMAQLAVAWVLQNDNVAAAIIGASRPEQVHENAKASGVEIPAELMARIDDALGDVVAARPRTHRSRGTRRTSHLTVSSALNTRRPRNRGSGAFVLQRRKQCGTYAWQVRTPFQQRQFARLVPVLRCFLCHRADQPRAHAS